MNNKQIGLVIAGCKGGYRLLCSNGVVDTQEEEINRTLSDIRSVIRINRNHLTLYALEFTSQYKVYSVYRSCNDNGSGAFVNIVLYVPHETRIDKTRELLDNMIDYYFKEYVNPLHGTYYPGTYDNITIFSDILRAAVTREETRHFTHRRSKQDDAPNFYVYNDVSEVDNLFASPYRKEFFDCQEVMFMPRQMYESGDDYFSFNRNPNIITRLSEQELMPVLCLKCREVTKLLINDIERDKNGQYPVNLSTDKLSVSVKYKYCSEVTVHGLVSDVLDNGELKLDVNTKTVSLGYIEKKYLKYGIRFTINGRSAPNGLIEIHSDKGNACEVYDSKVSLSDEWLENEWTIYAQPHLGSANDLVCVGKFKPLDYVDKELDIKLQEFMFNVSVTGSVKGNVYVNICGIKNPINIGRLKNNSRVTLYLPKDIDLKNTEFDPSLSEVEHKFDWDNKVLLLNCKILEYQLELPSQVKKMVLSWDFIINQSSKKKTSIWGGEIVKISPDEDISNGILSINGRKFDFNIDEDKILPKLVYVDNPDEVSYRYTAVGSDGKRIVEESKQSDLFPDGTNRKIESSDGDVNKEIISDFIIKLTRSWISAKEVTRAESGKPEQADIKVKFINCEGLYYETSSSSKRRPCSQQAVSLNSGSEQIVIYNKLNGGKKKCVVKYNGNTDEEQNENTRNGFNIISHGKNTRVEYKKSNKNLLKILVAIFAFALLGIASFFVTRLIMINTDSDMSIVMTIEVKLAEEPDLGERITTVEIPVDEKIATVAVEDGDYFIEVYWNKKAARKQYAILSDKKVKISFGHKEVNESLSEAIKNDLSKIIQPNQLIKDTLKIQTPLQKEFNELSSSPSTKMNEWKSFLDKYCREDEHFVNDQAIDAILTKAASDADRNEFLKVFKDYSEFAAYLRVSKLEEADKLETRIKDLQKKGESQWDALQKICTEDAVEKFNDWFTRNVLNSDIVDELKKHPDFPYTKYHTGIDLYLKFFNAKSYDELSSLYRDNRPKIKLYFTQEQERIFWAYTCADWAFNALYGTYKIQFVTPISDGVYAAIEKEYNRINKK